MSTNTQPVYGNLDGITDPDFPELDGTQQGLKGMYIPNLYIDPELKTETQNQE